jgi:hypothetical protein
MKSLMLLGGLAAVLCVGCAQNPEQVAKDDSYKAPVYRTGSNIPSGRETNQSSDVDGTAMMNALQPHGMPPGKGN